MTVDEIDTLASKYAYDIMTCPGSTEDIESVVESWASNEHHDDVFVWQPFEEWTPFDLYDQFEDLKNAFLKFAKEANS